LNLEVSTALDALGNGEVALLENTRFYPQETQNEAKFAQELAHQAFDPEVPV